MIFIMLPGESTRMFVVSSKNPSSSINPYEK